MNYLKIAACFALPALSVLALPGCMAGSEEGATLAGEATDQVSEAVSVAAGEESTMSRSAEGAPSDENVAEGSQALECGYGYGCGVGDCSFDGGCGAGWYPGFGAFRPGFGYWHPGFGYLPPAYNYLPPGYGYWRPSFGYFRPHFGYWRPGFGWRW